MEANLSLFPAYAESGLRQNLLRGFIKTADFSLQRNINNSRMTFLSLMEIMLTVQDSVLPHVMGQEYYEVFKEKFFDDDLSLTEKKALPLIKKAIAPLTIAQACKELPVKLNSRGLFINKFVDTKEYDQQEPADAARTQYLCDDHQEKGERRLVDLRDFLIKNAGSLPGFIPPSVISVNYNAEDSGIYLM
ncbi:DUF6712 family protein [Pedobacter sp. NJ-S-72]